MFSPLNDPQVEHWFQRLNGPLKRLPAEQRAELHAEVRQHLEALAKANEELGSTPEEAWEHALTQFGDPGKFGKKMAQEWQQGKTGFRADLAAILSVIGGQTLLGLVGYIPLWVWLHSHATLAGFPTAIATALSYVESLCLYTAVGRKYPFQALKAVFYERVFSSLSGWILIASIVFTEPKHYHIQWELWLHTMLTAPLYLAADMTISYLASVTKRGWYRPTWADFKLTWPKRRQISR